MKTLRRAPRYLWILPAGLWFAAWHLFGNWLVWQDPTHVVPGSLGDNVVMLWNLGWVRYALAHGDPGFWFTNAYYPEGFLFLFSTHTWLDGLLGFIASPLLPRGPEGTVLWANIVQLFATVATGLLSMAGLRQLGVKRWQIQLLGATALAFCWFRAFAGLGHYHFYGTEWMVGAVAAGAYARRLIRAGYSRQGLGWCFGAGTLVGLTFLNDQTQAVFATILFSCVLISLWWSRKLVPRRILVFSIVLGCLGVLVISSIHLVPIIRTIQSGQFTYKVANLHDPRIVDATSLLLPPDRHLMGGQHVAEFRRANHLTSEEGPYIGTSGYIFLMLGLAGSVAAIRQKSRGKRACSAKAMGAAVFGLGFLVMSFGDTLKIGSDTIVMMPGKLLHYIPVLNNIRLPQRWIWPGLICVVASGSIVLSCRWGHRLYRSHSAVLLSLAALFAAEGKWYPPSEPTSIYNARLNPPGLAKSLREKYKSGAVLTMPVEHAYAHGNHLQFMAGYDIPMTVLYTARPPFPVTDTPWKGTKWTTESGEWMRRKKVSIVILFFEGTPQTSAELGGYAEWIHGAREAVPGIVILNRSGEVI